MTYKNVFAEHVRLCLLRLLTESPGFEANSMILADGVNHYGLHCSRDLVNTQLSWLEEQRLIEIKPLTPTLALCKLLNRGHDVAEGRASVPGISKRTPEE